MDADAQATVETTADRWLLAAAFGVGVGMLLNAAEVGYGLSQLRNVSECIQWTVSPTLAAFASQAAGVEPVDGKAVVMEVFRSFSCPACRVSASAKDSV